MQKISHLLILVLIGSGYALKALHHRYQNRELRARESNFIEVNMQLTDAYLVLN